jgi:hypothetical protein
VLNRFDYSAIPPLVAAALQRYLDHGFPPGSYLAAVLQNDLKAAVRNADDDSLQGLPALVCWLHNYAPPPCYGSVENYRAWADGVERERPQVYNQRSEGYAHLRLPDPVDDYDYVADDLAFDADRETRR